VRITDSISIVEGEGSGEIVGAWCVCT